MNELFEFLDFKINTSTREIYKNNKKVDVQNKSYDLRAIFITNPKSH